MFFIGQDVDRRLLGIAGLGRIGRSVVRKARAFDMQIIYNDVQCSEDLERETDASLFDKATLLAQSDFLTLHAPLFPATRHYLGPAEFRQIKRSAMVIIDVENGGIEPVNLPSYYEAPGRMAVIGGTAQSG